MDDSVRMTVQRNLPLGIEYKLIGSWQTELEAGVTCHNCGAPIANCAEVESVHGKFVVGMDCAKTLCGDSMHFMYAESAFAMGKSARATLRKAIKENKGTNFRAETFTTAKNFYKEIGSGWWQYTLSTGGSIFKQYPKNVWCSHVLPMIKDLVSVK